jgi:hypothetical protein
VDDDTNDVDDTQVQGDEAAAESQPEREGSFLTPDQLEAIRKEAHDKAYADARRTFQAKTKPPQRTRQTAKQAEPDVDPGQWRDDFQDATCELQLEKGVLRRMRAAFKAEMPSDPDAWVESFCQDFKIGRQPQSQPQTQRHEVPEVQTPKGPSRSDGGAPSQSPVWEQPTNPLTWTQDDVDRIMALKGKVNGRKFIKEKFSDYMRNTHVILGDPGK